MIYIKLFLTFLKIGFVGFGGGMAILPLIYQGVSKFVPLTQADFADLFGISQATPGPIAINAATFGYNGANFSVTCNTAQEGKGLTVDQLSSIINGMQ